MQLQRLLPEQSDTSPFHKVRRSPPQYKGAILKETVAYVKTLKDEVKKIPQLEEEIQNYEKRIQKFLLLIQSYEETLQSHNIPVPQSIWIPSSKSDIENFIKQEPNYRNETACALSVPHVSNKTAVHFNTKLSQKFPHSLEQQSRPGRPVLQFLTVQSGMETNETPDKFTNANLTAFQSCISPLANFTQDDDLMENDDDLVNDDVMFHSRDSSTPDNMDLFS